MSQTIRDNSVAHIMQGLIWRAEHAWSMGTLAPMYFGFVTPASAEMAALGREYYSDGKSLKVDLYEASFTGGTIVTQLNRRLIYRQNTPPVIIRHGVTPGALTTRVTGFELTTAATIAVGKNDDHDVLVHDPAKSYVLAIENMVAGTQRYSFALDYRLMIPGEDK